MRRGETMFICVTIAILTLAWSASGATQQDVTAADTKKQSGNKKNAHPGPHPIGTPGLTGWVRHTEDQMVIISDKDKTIYKVDNKEALKAHEGRHVRITGTMTGDTVHVHSVRTLRQNHDGEHNQADKSKGKE